MERSGLLDRARNESSLGVGVGAHHQPGGVNDSSGFRPSTGGDYPSDGVSWGR